MGPILWIILSLLIIGILVVIVAYKRNKNIPPDYRTLFIVGLTWIPLGVATKNHAFTVIGVVFMIIGLKNKNKWKESRKGLAELSGSAKNLQIALIALAILLFIVVLAYYFYLGSERN